MKYGVCIVSIAPVRADHDDRSEMVTQLLFGEKVEIISEQGNWIKIMCGWAVSHHCEIIKFIGKYCGHI